MDVIRKSEESPHNTFTLTNSQKFEVFIMNQNELILIISQNDIIKRKRIIEYLSQVDFKVMYFVSSFGNLGLTCIVKPGLYYALIKQ